MRARKNKLTQIMLRKWTIQMEVKQRCSEDKIKGLEGITYTGDKDMFIGS